MTFQCPLVGRWKGRCEMAYDRKCHDLAGAFLKDAFWNGHQEQTFKDATQDKLAQRIQDEIEAFMGEEGLTI